MLFRKLEKSKKSKNETKNDREKSRLKKALIEDPSIKGEAENASNAEDIYDEDDFDE